MTGIDMKQKVLIVDDEPRNQRIISETLDNMVDFKVASSGEEALKIVTEFIPDLILLDIMMPGIDGYEVCKQFKVNPLLKLSKIILVSGKAMIEERLKGYDIGADDYMTKPFIPEELLAKTKVFLRLTTMERQLADLNRSLEEKVQDRTKQLLEAEAKLVNAARMAALGEMAGGIAHEINTPLGTMGLVGDQLGELLNENPIDVKTCKDMVRVIGTTVGHVAAIVRGLRTFSREGSKDKAVPTAFNQILNDTIALCAEKLKLNGICFQASGISDDLIIKCRSVEISQVVLNLISNSCDAVTHLSEKWIQLSVERQGDFVQISVTDSGSGIPEAIRDKIFQPFFTTKDIGKGTGLGLSISKGIIENHHGTLRFDSNCINTRFVIRLPITEESISKSALNKEAEL